MSNNKAIKTILHDFKMMYEKDKDSLTGDYEAKRNFETKSAALRDKVNQIMKEEENSLKEQKVRISQDALNAINMMKNRPYISKSDIDNLMHTYGDSYAAYKEIQNMAINNNYRLPYVHELEGKDKELENMKSLLNKTISYNGAKGGLTSDAFISNFESSIDSVIPDNSGEGE